MMNNKSLLEAFNVNLKERDIEQIDYNVFKDKELLDFLRIKILEDLSDKGLFKSNLGNDLINEEISLVTRGYDLSTLERNYLYNLVDNEINGYGPLTELLKDNNITEIMVNSPKEIFIEIDGKIEQDKSISFINEEHIVRQKY